MDTYSNRHEIYFSNFHLRMPILHKYRYLTSLDRAPQFRPPVCLRYGMWLIAASMSDKYQSYEGVFYERVRRYIHMDEMKVCPASASSLWRS